MRRDLDAEMVRWPGTQGWLRKTSKAVLAWYLLRAAYEELEPWIVTSFPAPPPDPKSRVQRAAIEEAEIFFDSILDAARDLTPELMVIDSIQTVYKSSLASAPGSVAQVRECGGDLMRFAKERAVTTVL